MQLQQPPQPEDPREIPHDPGRNHDDIPDTPPTEMPPIPVQDPPPDSQEPGPWIS
jgi:hypothetical protein